MSIGTLLAYTIVSASVIILRYKPENASDQQKILKDGDDVSISTTSTQSDNLELSQVGRLKSEYWWLSSVVGGCGHSGATSGAVFIFTCCSAALCVQIHFSATDIKAGEWWAILTLTFFTICLLGCLFVISAHHQNVSTGTFRVPWVPLLPGLSILSNVGLMVHLNVLTWVRFMVWMTLGLLVYFLYGIRHSKEGDLTSTYSMLMSSSEANKGPWGTMSPREQATPKAPSEPSGGTKGSTIVSIKAKKYKNISDDEDDDDQ